MSRLKQDSLTETTRFRQAVYVKWAGKVLIPDLCGSNLGYKYILLTCFLEQLTYNHNPRFATVRGYVQSINLLFQLWNFLNPGDLLEKGNICSKITIAREHNNIAKQHSHITREMSVAMANKAQVSKIDSINSLLYDWFCLIRITGLQVAKYAQTKQTSVDVHKSPSGKAVIKAFIASDWICYDKKGNTIDASCSESMLVKVKVTSRIQKTGGMGNQL